MMPSREQLNQKRREQRQKFLGLPEDAYSLNRIQELAGISKETCDVWLETTGIKEYDDVLNNVEPRILSDLKGQIVMMNPDEYLAKTQQMKSGLSSYEDSSEIEDLYYVSPMIEQIKKEMESGKMFPLLFLDLVSNISKENNLVVWAAKLFGCPQIPVAVFIKKEKEDLREMEESKERKEQVYYTMANGYMPGLIEKLKEKNIEFKYDGYSNFCDITVYSDEEKKLADTIINSEEVEGDLWDHENFPEDVEGDAARITLVKKMTLSEGFKKRIQELSGIKNKSL